VRRIFLLSPAKVSGIRAQQLLNPDAAFDLAHRFRAEGLPLADIFAFTSALYFRGKIAYAAFRANGAVLTGKRAPRLDRKKERMNTNRDDESAPKSSHEVNEERDHD